MTTSTPILPSHERIRVEDYLNDKIQVSSDLHSLDSLLSSLRAQHELQRKQVLFRLFFNPLSGLSSSGN